MCRRQKALHLLLKSPAPFRKKMQGFFHVDAVLFSRSAGAQQETRREE